MRERYLQIEMPNGSVWEAPYIPLILLSVKRGVEHGHIDEENAEAHKSFLLEEIYHAAQVHDDLMDLSWDEVVPFAVQVRPPDPPPYGEWWKETNAFHSFHFVEREPETKG